MDSRRFRVNKALTIVPNERGDLTAVNTNTGNAFRVSTHMFAILEAFSQPISIDAAIERLKPMYSGNAESEVRDFIGKMCAGYYLVAEEQSGMSPHDLNYFGAYQHLSNQKEMLMDTARTRAFADALDEVVSSDDIVVDVGCGSGILSLMAAKQGAQRVYAIERSNMINIAKAVAEKNGCSDRIIFEQCMAEEFTCPDKATVIVSEWLGDFVLRELMFKSVVSVRDRCAAPGARSMPSRVRMYVALVEDALLWQEVGPNYWSSPVYGFDYTPAFEVECARLGSKRVTVPETSLLSERAVINDIDCETAPVGKFYFDNQVEFTVSRNGSLHGLAGSFDMQLGPSVWLDTGSQAKGTHWEQVFFPLMDALPVRINDRIVLKLKAEEPENPQKRIPDMYLELEVHRGAEIVHQFSHWYDKARHGVF